jgi:hypothetical protein
MINAPRSQRGGEANWKGMGYQKKFIAYLCCDMLLRNNIKRVTCEHLDDIEVEVDSKLVYYQTKSTTQSTLSRREIRESFELFLENNNTGSSRLTNKDIEYILVSNARIGNFTARDRIFPFKDLRESIKNEIRLIPGINDTFLQKTFLMIGPVPEDIKNLVVGALVRILKDENYDYKFEEIAESILSEIDRMCSGPTDLFDQRMLKIDEEEEYILEHKSMTLEKLNQIINNHSERKQTEPPKLNRVSKTITFKYNIRGRSPSPEELDKIHQMIREYKTFDEGDKKQYTYLKKFEEKSGSLLLYEDPRFLSFLKNLIRSSQDKHIILGCLYVLHRLIIISKIEESKKFLKYVYDNYFRIFKKALEIRESRFEYSLFKIQHILEELSGFISSQDLCELYWRRMVETIKVMKVTGLTDNSLWNCIVNLNKCELRQKWRKWLIRKDDYSSIKDAVIEELRNF